MFYRFCTFARAVASTGFPKVTNSLCEAFVYFLSFLVTSLLTVHSANKTVGVFWLNAAETWIDISIEDGKKVEVIFCCWNLHFVNFFK